MLVSVVDVFMVSYTDIDTGGLWDTFGGGPRYIVLVSVGFS